MDPGLVRWSVHRRPHWPLLLMAGALACAFAIGSTLLCRMLMTEPSWLIAGTVGTALGLLLMLQVWSGATVRVGADRILIYRLRGVDMISVPIDQIAGLTYIETGALIGVGIQCPSAALTFLSRKGPSLRQVDAWQAKLGVALVLEHLTRADCDHLAGLLARR